MTPFDPLLLHQQKEAIAKGLESMDQELSNLSVKQPSSQFDERPLAEVLKEKRLATDKILENTKNVIQQESIEERRQRLRAHRD